MIKRCFITIYSYNNSLNKQKFLEALKSLNPIYAVVCEEYSIIPSSKHMHAYVEFINDITIEDLRNLFSMYYCYYNITHAFGSKKSNIEYCSKEDKCPLILEVNNVKKN